MKTFWQDLRFSRVGPADPVTFAIIPIALFAATLVAGYIPARRAIKIDPLMALRAE